MNHLGDTNKMVSDTPRMDASAYDDGAIWETGCDIERELKAANDRIKRLEENLMDMKNKHAALVADVALYEDRGERIKRLEEAGDAVEERLGCGCGCGGPCRACQSESENWFKAKEAKP